MSIHWVETPRTLTHFEAKPPAAEGFDNELGLDAGHVQHIAELFDTPLTGAYNWDYRYRTTGSTSSMNSAKS